MGYGFVGKILFSAPNPNSSPGLDAQAIMELLDITEQVEGFKRLMH
jgi:hypothetical protein